MAIKFFLLIHEIHHQNIKRKISSEMLKEKENVIHL